jgi:hypothetical protein
VDDRTTDLETDLDTHFLGFCVTTVTTDLETDLGPTWTPIFWVSVLFFLLALFMSSSLEISKGVNHGIAAKPIR